MEGKNKVRFETVFLDRSLPVDERIDELIYWSRKFDELGLTPNSAGNLSFRTEKGFIISGTGVELGDIENKDFVEVLRTQRTIKGKIFVFAKGQVIPSKESLLHEVIYNLRPEINAVFHCHDKIALESVDRLDIPCTEKEQPPGSYELVEEVRILLNFEKNIKYFFLKNHGIVSMGKDTEEAGIMAEFIHTMAQVIEKRKEK